MNIIIDIFIILLVLTLFVTGIKKGMVKIVFGLAGFFAAVVIAWLYSEKVGTVFFGFLPPFIKTVAGFLLLFAGMILIFIILSWLFSKALDLILLGWLNRILGGIAGLALGFIFCVFLIWFAPKFYPKIKESYKRSITVPLITNITRSITGNRIFPEDFLEGSKKIKV